jgi:hypothetical protein
MGGPSDLVAAVLELLRDQVRERRGCLLDAESVQAVRVFEEAAPEAAEVSRRLELHAPVPRLAAVHGAVRARLEQGPFTRIVGRVAQFSGHDACVRFRALPKTDAQPTAVAAAVRDARQAGRAAGGRPLDDPPPEVCLERVQALRRLVDPEAVLLPQMLWLAAQSEEMLHPEGRAARTPATTSAPR